MISGNEQGGFARDDSGLGGTAASFPNTLKKRVIPNESTIDTIRKPWIFGG